MRDFTKWEIQYHYPHMRDFEVNLIEKYILEYPRAYEEVAYSYPVGHGAPTNPIVNDETEGSVEYLYYKKIDILAKKQGKITIIEVKKKAGASAIGQVLGYRDLYILDEKLSTKPSCVILTDEASPDLLHIAKKQGVEIIVV